MKELKPGVYTFSLADSFGNVKSCQVDNVNLLLASPDLCAKLVERLAYKTWKAQHPEDVAAFAAKVEAAQRARGEA